MSQAHAPLDATLPTGARTPLAGDQPVRPAVSLRGVGYTYPGTARPVLADVDLDLAQGEHLAVVGRSGCGKSTLLSLIAGLVEPDGGSLAVLGHDGAAARLAACALMPQGDSLLPWLSLVDNVAITLRNRRVPKPEARARALASLRRWGLAEWSAARPAQLSGGMRQRAALARALLADKPVLLADEPLGSLDAITRAEGQGWLRAALTQGSATLVLVTHDVDEALLLARRVVLLASPAPGDPPAVPAPATGATAVASWPGFFDDDRPRSALLGDPGFAQVRREVLDALAAHPSSPGIAADPTAELPAGRRSAGQGERR